MFCIGKKNKGQCLSILDLVKGHQKCYAQNGSNFQEFLEKEIYLSRAEKPEPVGAALFLRGAGAAL